ncbi:MAG: DUF167 domain-containing protein [Steroidobacteraceae bacterium]|nr:DUF167 domain-containing protein [Steroidobacteraceae bacterium]
MYVQPRAARTVVAGMHDGAIKIRLAAPPVDGAANAALVEFIAERLGLAKARVRIVAGQSSRRKIVEVESSASPAEIEAALGTHVAR